MCFFFLFKSLHSFVIQMNNISETNLNSSADDLDDLASKQVRNVLKCSFLGMIGVQHLHLFVYFRRINIFRMNYTSKLKNCETSRLQSLLASCLWWYVTTQKTLKFKELILINIHYKVFFFLALHELG